MMLDASIVQYYCLKVDQIYKGLTLPVDLMGGGGGGGARSSSFSMQKMGDKIQKYKEDINERFRTLPRVSRGL